VSAATGLLKISKDLLSKKPEKNPDKEKKTNIKQTKCFQN